MNTKAIDASQPTRNFFLVIAITALVLVVFGFAPSFYLRNLYGKQPLPNLLWWHGVIFSSWMILLVTQTALVRAGNVQLHRRLGLISVLLIPAMLTLGLTVAIDTAAHGIGGARLGLTPLEFLIVPLGAIVMFTILVSVALLFRRNAALHKRLMIIATINLVGPALARIADNVFHLDNASPFLFVTTASLIGTCIIYDRLTRGSVHPGFLIVGPIVLLAAPLRIVFSHTTAWHTVASWLIAK